MLYLSLVLIIAGLVLLLLGIFSGMEKPVFSEEPALEPSPRGRGFYEEFTPSAYSAGPIREPAVRNRGPIDPDFEKPIEDNDALIPESSGLASRTEGSILDELNDHYDGREAGGREEAVDQDKAMSGYTAVLYEDTSGLINYEDGTPFIDSSLEGYRKLKRVGGGRVELASEGINFHAGKSFFRFDFRRVEKLKIGRNFFVLFIQGSPAARLFLFNAETPFLHQVRKGLETYLKDAG